MLNVTALFEYPILNGAENSFLAVAPVLGELGVRLSCFAPPIGPVARRLDAMGILAGPFEVKAGDTRKTHDQLRAEMGTILVGRPCDLVHANSLSMARLVGQVGRELGVPSIGYLRDIVGISRKTVDDLNQNTTLIAVSQAVKKFHVNGGLDASRIQVVHNGVDLIEFQPRASTGWLHRELGLEPEKLIVGGIGQLGRRKGWDTFVEAANQASRSNRNIHFAVVGERTSQHREAMELEQALTLATKSAPLEGRLHLLGRREEVPAILNELAMLVHAARQEPLGRVLLEAAASGTPTIATDVGGTAEIFPNGEAILVPPDQPAPMAESILQLAKDPPAASCIG